MKQPDEALELLLQSAAPIGRRQRVTLSDSVNRTLAANVIARLDVPPADNSAMDGYALRCQDLENVSTLPLSQRITAGSAPKPLQAGTAARIFTGAEIPAGANTVVMQENCHESPDGSMVHFDLPVEPNNNIRPRGQDIHKGQIVCHKGDIITPPVIGLLASLGIAELDVMAPLKVALLCTGDELVEPGSPLQSGQIYNSNRYTLTALLQSQAFEVIDCSAVADTFEATCEALTAAAEAADVIISTGGVSVGEEDHVRDAVKTLGTLQLWKLAIKPGKPLAFGQVGTTPFIGLPGNPLSAWVTFLFFARPFLQRCQGRVPNDHSAQPARISWPAGFKRKAFSRTQYLMVRAENGKPLQLYDNQSSGILYSAAWGNAIAIVPPETPIEAGQSLNIVLTAQLLAPFQPLTQTRNSGPSHG